MLSLLILVAPAAALLAPATQVLAVPISGAIVNPANGHTYYLLEKTTWAAAEAEAVSLGGHLATVNDEAEDAWIFATFGSFGGVERSLFIGLNDIALEGVFEWTSGQPVTYVNWAANEPNNNNGTEDVVVIFGPQDSNASFWNDGDNDPGAYPDFGVAEVVPEPSTFLLFAIGLIGLTLRSRKRWLP